jgi:nucleotide-binding universal stress UspA family protein
MVVVDDTPECARAVHFAARRASRTGASMVMLAVVDPPDNFEWIGVGEAMIAEAQEEAEKRLEEAAKEARAAAGLDPEQVIRVGEKSASITKLIEEDEDISFLVLAAGTGKEGPGAAGVLHCGQGRVDLSHSDRHRARESLRRRDRRAGGLGCRDARRLMPHQWAALARA